MLSYLVLNLTLMTAYNRGAEFNMKPGGSLRCLPVSREMPGTTEWKLPRGHSALGHRGSGVTGCLKTRNCLQGGTTALITLISGDKCSKKGSNGFLKPEELSNYPEATLKEHLPCKSICHRVPLNIQFTHRSANCVCFWKSFPLAQLYKTMHLTAQSQSRASSEFLSNTRIYD